MSGYRRKYNGSLNREYISRSEFEYFERSVNANFSNLNDSMSDITAKLDKLGTTDFKTIGLFAGLLFTLISFAAILIGREITSIEKKYTEKHNNLYELVRYNQEHAIETKTNRYTSEDHEKYSDRQIEEHRRIVDLFNEELKVIRLNQDKTENRVRELEIQLARELGHKP